MYIVGAVGYSNSGKTTALSVLVRGLKQHGYSVLVAKDIHRQGVKFDTPGKDTWIYRESGADYVLGKTLEDAALFLPPTISFEAIVALARQLGVDFLVVEGFARTFQCPRFFCARTADQWESFLADRGPQEILCVVGPAAKEIAQQTGQTACDPLHRPDEFVSFVLRKLIA